MERLGKNKDGYRGEQIRIREVLAEIAVTARNHGWSTETFHTADKFDWCALQRSPTRAQCRYYLSAGIHGDEPAGPLAALRLLQLNEWPESAEIVLLPCLNPLGFLRNSRENPQGIDLNRDYRQPKSSETSAHLTWLAKQRNFDRCLCLHEDWESQGFYLYELNPDQGPSAAEAMITAAAKICPIDQSEIIEGRAAQGGIIRPQLDPRTRPLWAESFWLLQHKTRLSYTLEAPSDFPLQTRVNALVAAARAALA